MRLLPIVTYLLSGGGRSRPTLLSAEDLHLLKTNLKEQLLKDERVWPGTMSRESLELARMLERLRPVDECSSLVDDWRREYGEFDVLSCDPLVVALEYNEASVVRGGFLARASDDGRVELRIEIKWRSDEILPVELNGTLTALDGGRVEVSLVTGAVRSPTSGEIQDMMDAQGTLRERSEPAIQRHGGFGATFEFGYLDGDLAILRACEGKQCAAGTAVVLSRADPESFDESWFKYARTRTYYDALGREKKMDLPY